MQMGSLPPARFAVRDHGGGRLTLEACGPQVRTVVISGYDGPPLPPELDDALLERLGPAAWRLRTDERSYDFGARALEVLEPQPVLFDGLLSSFALKRRDRKLVGVLLVLLRLPGGAWLLRRWHARRR